MLVAFARRWPRDGWRGGSAGTCRSGRCCRTSRRRSRHRSGFAILGEQRRRRHQLPRLAVAALRHLLGDPRHLQRVASSRATAPRSSSPSCPPPAPRSSARADGLRRRGAPCRRRTGRCRSRTSCPVRPSVVAKHPEQRHVGGDVDVVARAVDGEGNHVRLLRTKCSMGRETLRLPRCSVAVQPGHRAGHHLDRIGYQLVRLDGAPGLSSWCGPP